jgi:lipopolysaccharide transport system ATP-binding protein
LNCPVGETTVCTCMIPGSFLNDDLYQIDVYFHTAGMSKLYVNHNILSFEIKDKARENGFLGKINGVIRPSLRWESNATASFT